MSTRYLHPNRVKADAVFARLARERMLSPRTTMTREQRDQADAINSRYLAWIATLGERQEARCGRSVPRGVLKVNNFPAERPRTSPEEHAVIVRQMQRYTQLIARKKREVARYEQQVGVPVQLAEVR